MLRALATIVLAALCLLAWPRSARAQQVLLLRPAAADATLSEAFNRLRAELLLHDFSVEVLDVEGQRLSPDELEEAARRRGAFAGVALARRGTGANADLYIADRLTGKISLRRLSIVSGSDAPRVLAVRAVDLLRESLGEMSSDEKPPPDVVGVDRNEVSAAIRAFTEQARFRVSAAFFGLATARDISSGFGAGLGVGYRVSQRFELGALLVGPLFGARYQSAIGDATLRQELGLLRGSFNLLNPGRLELGPVLGAGVYHLLAQGEVAAPLTAASVSRWTLAASGGIGASLALGRTVSLVAAAQGVWLAREPEVAVLAESEALGQPVLLASCGLGVSF